MPDTTPTPTALVSSDDLRPLYDAIESGTEGGDWPAFLAVLAARDAAVRTAAIREAADAIVAQLRGCCDECDACIEITQDITDALATAPTTTTTPQEH